MEPKLAKAVVKAVEELIDLISDPDNGHPEILGIHVTPDPMNPDTHLAAWAEVGSIVHPHTFQYAIYINKETGETETDGY